MTLRGARILSSCNDASNRQEQNMSVNIKVEDKTPQPQAQPTTIQQIIQQPTQSGAVSFPHSIQQTIEQPPVTSTVQPSIQQTITQPTTTTPPAQPIAQSIAQPVYVHPQPQQVYVQPVNFTTLEQQQLPTSSTPPTTATTTVTPQTTVTMPTSNGSLTPPPEVLTYPSTVPNMANYTATGVLSRDFDLDKDIQIQDLETKNKFLTLMLTVYQNNPLYINSYVVCESKILMDMIKLLTGCEKVDLVLSDDVACGGCTGNSNLIYISKILITKDGKTEEFKYSYHEIYSKFISYGISLKVVV